MPAMISKSTYHSVNIKPKKYKEKNTNHRHKKNDPK